MNGGATPYQHYGGKWLCRHFEAVAIPFFRWRDSDNPCGTPAPITAVEFPTTIRNVHPPEAMPNYNSHTANLLSRCLTGYAYSASSRMSRERTDWRPTCRKSTCRYGVKLHSANHSDAAARRTGQSSTKSLGLPRTPYGCRPDGRTGDVFRFYSDASTEDRPAALTAKGLKSALACIRQVLGCRGSEPTEGRPAGSQLAAEGFL